MNQHPTRKAILSVVRLLLVTVMCMVGAGPRLEAQAGEGKTASSSKTYKIINGLWFDGHGFRPDTFYVVDGILKRTAPVQIDDVLDLAGQFVVPPFGEAHNHNVEGPWNLDRVIARYLTDGVFYVKIPGNIQEFTERIRRNVNRPTSVDVVFSNGGLTATGGHPAPLYEEVLATARYEPIVEHLEKGWFDNRGYFSIDSAGDLEDKWKVIRAGKPDFIKIFLAHSEDFDRRRSISSPTVHSGLDPKLVPLVVKKVHADGLRVSSHVETAEDFRHALRAGVDEITHLPGWWISGPEDVAAARLTEDDAAQAARMKVVVVTTTVAGQRMPGHSDHSERGRHHDAGPVGGHSSAHSSNDSASARDVLKDNLRLLHRHGVRIAIGSDHADTSLDEARFLRELGVFDNLTLLRLWCEATPKAIFPDRAIGRLDEGYEASFLVLKDNPIERFESVTEITLRIKQGYVLSTK